MRVATDGSCLKNPGGKTGWAWVAEDGRWQSGSLPEGSNNIGELMAAIAALHAHRKVEKLHLEIDSQYVLNIAQKWGKAWRRKGWKKADGSPVANIKLVSRLLDLVDRPGLTMEWVRGHNGHWLNELTDERAGSAARLQTPTTKGRFTPDEIAEAVLADGDAKAAAAKKRAAKKVAAKPPVGNAPKATPRELEKAADDLLRSSEAKKKAHKRHKSTPYMAGGKKRPKPKPKSS